MLEKMHFTAWEFERGFGLRDWWREFDVSLLQECFVFGELVSFSSSATMAFQTKHSCYFVCTGGLRGQE